MRWDLPFLPSCRSSMPPVKSNVLRNGTVAGNVGQLQPIQMMRVCLVSGGVYKHPLASKVDVATALIRGLLLDLPPPLRGDAANLDFVFDDDAFQQAWLRLADDGGVNMQHNT